MTTPRERPLLTIDHRALKTPAATWFDLEMEKLWIETGCTVADMMTDRYGPGRSRARELSRKYNQILKGKIEVPR